MPKQKPSVPSIAQLTIDLKSGKLLPVYFFFGEDSYSIETELEIIEKTVKPFISSDFDNETFYSEDKSLTDILNIATAFPFGSEKKFITIKEFEKIKDKKLLTSYVNSPPDFTILAIIQEGKIANFDTEPYKTLVTKKFIFEAKELKGESLVGWLINHVKDKGKSLSLDNARFLIDIVGENREMLEAQLEKIFVYLDKENEITLSTIKSLSTALKEYTVFDLQNSLGKKNKSSALKVAYSMLEKGAEPVYMISMLTRYFTGLSRIKELKANKVPDQIAAKIVGTHPYYYKDYLAARQIYSDSELYNAAQSLLKADLSLKTTSIDNKTLITILISEILR